jgi:hypothetical protein
MPSRMNCVTCGRITGRKKLHVSCKQGQERSCEIFRGLH